MNNEDFLIAISGVSQQPAQPSCEPVRTQYRVPQSGGGFSEWRNPPVDEDVPSGRNYEFRKLYAAPPDLAAILAENAQLKESNKSMAQTLNYVERWANHHAVKPRMTAVEALSCIQHYPRILDITRGYADGKVPATPNPFAERDALKAQLSSIKSAISDDGMAISYQSMGQYRTSLLRLCK